MAELDPILIPAIYDLVASLGKSVIIKAPPPAVAFDVVTSRKTTLTEGPSYPVKVTPPEPWMDQRDKSRGCKTYLPSQGLTFIPDRQMKVVMDGLTWTIADEIGRVYTGDKVGLYILYLKA